jgi:hypothetical protein
LVLGIIKWTAWASPTVLDFSRSHTMEDLRQSGLEISEMYSGVFESYSFKNQEVEIRLPAGRSIHHNIELGIIDTKNKQLVRISMTGDVMPHDQAYKVAMLFHKSFGLSQNSLTQWEIVNRGKIRNGEGYSISANLNYYPRISFGIDPSINGLYPWVVNLLISWDWDKQREWNEERAWRELPPPSSQLATISLNPPSGSKYERKEAYKKEIAETEALRAKLRAEGKLAAVQESPTVKTLKPESTAEPVQASLAQPSPSTPAWPWAVGLLLLAVMGGVWWKFLRK